VEQFPEVAVGLEDSGTAGALHPLLELQNDALQQRREQKNGENLRDLQQDIAGHDVRPGMQRERCEARPRRPCPERAG